MVAGKNNPQALGIYTIEFFYTVKFTLLSTSCMRKEALQCLQQIIQQDQKLPNRLSLLLDLLPLLILKIQQLKLLQLHQ